MSQSESGDKVIPVGICQCGCGGQTKLVTKTSTRQGLVKGEFFRYINGHSRKNADFFSCGHPRTHDNFRKNGGGIVKCATCSLVRQRSYMAKHRKHWTAVAKQWRDNNLERAREIVKKWSDGHRDKIREKCKERSVSGKVVAARHHISLPKYHALLEKQNGVCAICGNPPLTGKRLAVDHDHSCCKGPRSCGKCIRGLLCQQCNHMLGNARDEIITLASAIVYLSAKLSGTV